MGKVSRHPARYLIAGCNGAGKTTFAKIFLPTEVKCLRFLNADEIARGLSPLAPAQSAIKAGRILLEEISACLQRKETFALESTLSGKTYIKLFQRALALGYEIELHYLWLASPKQAIARVRRRVQMGGHPVPASDIRRRFKRSLMHLCDDYLPVVTRWTLWDNRSLPSCPIASSVETPIVAVKQLLLK
ncbi:MAG: zeta toxin family protein [Opitutaceae bacterium]|jgi:predicted ABC-type ATPase|nr:zeta toxin family protein [Opitutaceae bacterium]